MQGDLDQEAWERSHIEAALSEADTGDFLPEKEMAAKFNQLGQRKNAEGHPRTESDSRRARLIFRWII